MYSENSHLIDAEAYCNNYEYMSYWSKYGNLPKFIRRYEEAIYGKNPSDMEHCINNTRQNVAIVHFHITSSANDLINKIMKSPRVTHADILSNIGTYLSKIAPKNLPFIGILFHSFFIFQVEPWACLQVSVSLAFLK